MHAVLKKGEGTLTAVDYPLEFGLMTFGLNTQPSCNNLCHVC